MEVRGGGALERARDASGWRGRIGPWGRTRCRRVQPCAGARKAGDASRRYFNRFLRSGSLGVGGSIPPSSTKKFAGLAIRSPAPFSFGAGWSRFAPSWPESGKARLRSRVSTTTVESAGSTRHSRRVDCAIAPQDAGLPLAPRESDSHPTA